MRRGTINADDLLEAMTTVHKMGNLAELFDKLPFWPRGLPETLDVEQDRLLRFRAIARSMTDEERDNPALLAAAVGTREWWVRYNDRRVQRVALGAGCRAEDVEDFVRRFLTYGRLLDEMGSRGLLQALKDWIHGKDR